MAARAAIFAELVKSVASVDDPVLSLLHTNARLAPWRHMLPRNHFENTIEAMPEGYPSKWTRVKAAEHFKTVLEALDCDMAVLQKA